MIKSLSLSNFQGHKDSTLELSEGVNVIVGSSDSGKSSIIRALQWVVFNRPSGDAFRSWWGGETKVVMEVPGTDVHRIKNDKDNQYIAEGRGLPGADIFKAFGQGVPEEVSEALNLSSINIQTQHDPPFLLSQSPGEVAKYLNEIVNLDKIDSSLSYINQKSRKVKSDISYKESEIDKLEKELENYNWIDDAEPLLSNLEERFKAMSGMESANVNLEKLIVMIESELSRIVKLDEVIKEEKRINNLISLYSKIETMEEDKNKLMDHCGHIVSEGTWIEEYDSIIDLDNSVRKLINLDDQLATISRNKANLYQAVVSIKNAELAINVKRQKLDKFEIDFNLLMPDQCPLCGQEVK